MTADRLRGSRPAGVLRCLIALLAVSCLWSGAPVLAQEVSASVTGVVSDPSGAVIPAAAITVTEVDRATVWTATTNAQGIYAIPRVPAGLYTLRVEAEGFRSALRPEFVLETNQRARINIELEVGQVTETVEVSAEAPLLNTDTTIVGQTVTQAQLTDTPLASRNYIELTLQTPGVTVTNQAGLRDGQRSGYSQARPYVNGNRAQANNFLLDGIDNNQVSDNYTSYNPNVDAIQEVKMITNNASAEFGNFQGAIMNVIMKGGTNKFHGSLFEFLQNDKLNANNWARNWLGNERRPVRWNQFGGTFGGPIKANKLFFFANYQGLRRANPGAASTISVIPGEFRQGDFSRLASEQGVQLFDPFDLDGAGQRRPFANNQIPMSRIDPVAGALFNRQELYPLPTNGGLELNQFNTRNSQLKTDQGDIKTDYKASSKDDISFRYSRGRQDLPSTNTFPLRFGSFSRSPFQAGVLNWTRALSATVVNEARFGVNRIVIDNGGTDNGVGNLAEELGIIDGNKASSGLQQLRFSNGFADSIGSSNVGSRALFANATFHFADNITFVRGRHIFKTGGQVLRQRMNTLYTGNTGRTGFIRFDGRFTGAIPAAGQKPVFGFAEADFFLGAVSRSGRGVDGTWGHRKTILGFYFQDDWRVTNTLTVNLGLRWERHSPLVEVNDRQANFSPFTGELLLAGKNGNSRALYEPFNKDFQPRIGFAWTPSAFGGSTVIRGAYTISSFMEGSGTNLRLPINPPFQTESEAIFDSAFGLQPEISTAQGIAALSSANPFDRANIRLWDPRVRPANTQQWSFIVERQLPGQQVLSIGYIGQKGSRLIVPMPYFQRRLLAGGATEASPYLSGNPLLAGIAQISGTEANGNMQYHALQINLRKRMTGGLTYQGSYTFSKSLTDSLGFFGDVGQVRGPSAYWQNLYDRKAEWGPSFFDAAHNFNGSVVYELPFGEGKAVGGSWGPAANAVLGGWRLGSLISMRSGFAMTIRAPDVSGTRSRGARADRVGDGTNGPKTVGPTGQWFDTAAYRVPAQGTLGTAGNGTFRGPGLFDLSLSLQKNFTIAEGKTLQFRTEAIGLTNTPAFQGLVRNVNSRRFGQIRGSQGERRVQFGLKFLF